jgi:hypothetical protein
MTLNILDTSKIINYTNIQLYDMQSQVFLENFLSGITGCGIENAECRIRITDFKFQVSGIDRMQVAKIKLNNSKLNT